MAKSRPDTIILRGDPIIKEGATSEKLFPGHIVEVGGAKDVRLQSVAKRNCTRNFVLEDINAGNEIEDFYDVNTKVRYGSFTHGMEAQVRIAAKAVAIVKGDPLEAKGNGTVGKFTDGAIIAYALESKDNSKSEEETMIKIEVC